MREIFQRQAVLKIFNFRHKGYMRHYLDIWCTSTCRKLFIALRCIPNFLASSMFGSSTYDDMIIIMTVIRALLIYDLSNMT